jgi:hypothetical protein
MGSQKFGYLNAFLKQFKQLGKNIKTRKEQDDL